MFTNYTQAAIAILCSISGGIRVQPDIFPLTDEEQQMILHKLETAGLVRLIPGCAKGLPFSYQLCRPCREISILDIIEALGEPVRFDRPMPESCYGSHPLAAHKLGVINHMTRLFLSEIKMTDW